MNYCNLAYRLNYDKKVDMRTIMIVIDQYQVTRSAGEATNKHKAMKLNKQEVTRRKLDSNWLTLLKLTGNT